MGRPEGERQILEAGALSSWEKGTAADLALSPICLFFSIFFFFFFANSDSGAQEQIQCDLRGLAGSWTLPSACEKTSSLPSLFVLFHFTLVVLFSVINLAWSLFSQVYTAALSEFSCNTWDVSLASSLCSICVLGSGVLEHEISYCFLCRQYAMISLYSESTYWLSVMFTCRTNLC